MNTIGFDNLKCVDLTLETSVSGQLWSREAKHRHPWHLVVVRIC